MSLEKLKKDWNELGNIDPLYAILTFEDKKFNKWDINEFFLTGDREIEEVMRLAEELGYPLQRESALDFGCGAGRLTRALSKYFTHCYGIDISESMIIKAKELNQHLLNCEFILNDKPNLRIFSNNQFDMIYTYIVLQHLPTKSLIKSYISEFYRILEGNGLLVFQLLVVSSD